MDRIGVGGVLLRGNQILLGKRSRDRSFYPGVWDIVGGHLIEEETPEQTLTREFKEELGVVPREYHLLSILPEPNPDYNGAGRYYVYLVTKWDGVPQNLQETEHSDLAWIRLDEIDTLELALPSYTTLFRSIRAVR